MELFIFYLYFFLAFLRRCWGVGYTIVLSKYPLVHTNYNLHPATIGGNTAHPFFLTVQVNVLALVYKKMK